MGGRARFKSLIYLRGDCGRHDDATAGRSGADSRDGENEGEKKEIKVRGVFRCRHLGALACATLLLRDAGVPFASLLPVFLFLPFSRISGRLRQEAITRK